MLEHELGRGGMATVYLARDLKHDRPVALKALHPELAAIVGPERFLREIRLAARLQHPHILTVLDSGEAAGLLWYTMPYVEGESLRARLERESQLPIDDALRITTEASLALDYAHRHGVVHRDIKPENILLSDGQALVADFGVARALEQGSEGKLTETGMAVGTPAYMSPEQASGGSVDGRSDIYALGCVLYETLAGEPPYTGPTPQAIIAKRFADPVPSIRRLRETVPEVVDKALTQAMAKTPADRFSSAAGFARALQDPGPTALLAVPTPKTRKKVARVPLALPLGLITGLALVFVWTRLPPNDGAAVTGVRRIAVLPFENVGGTDKEYFVDGISDEVRGKLAEVSGLQVTARTSSTQYRRTSKSPRQIGRELGVDYLLTGTVRLKPEGGRQLVRVSPELVQAVNGSTRWQETFEVPITDLSSMQGDLAARVAEELGVALVAGQRQHLSERATSDLTAYDLYLRGRYAWHQRTAEGLKQARQFFEQAIQLDPRYALAHSGLADVYTVLPLWSDVPPEQTYPRAKAAALEALSLDSTLAEPLATIADVNAMYDWDWDVAERRFRHALALDPNNANTYLWYSGDCLFPLGRRAEALEKIRRARELDPLSVLINAGVGQDLYRIGRVEEAKAQLRAVLSLDPGFTLASMWLGQIYVEEGRAAEAVPLLERGVDPKVSHSNNIAMLGFGYAKAGRRAEAVTLLRELLDRRLRGYVSPANIAVLTAGLGDTTETFRWLQRAVEVRDPFLIYNFVTEPLLESFRRDRRGVAILKAMGLRYNSE